MNRDKKIQPILVDEIKIVLINYLKTQFVLMLIVTALVWGALSLIGVKYAVILAFGTGALSAVPFFGMTIASIIAGLVAIFDQVVFLSSMPFAVSTTLIISPLFDVIFTLSSICTFNFLAVSACRIATGLPAIKPSDFTFSSIFDYYSYILFSNY